MRSRRILGARRAFFPQAALVAVLVVVVPALSNRPTHIETSPTCAQIGAAPDSQRSPASAGNDQQATNCAPGSGAVKHGWIQTAAAQRKRRRPRRRARKPAPKTQRPAQEQVFDFTGLNIAGQMRTPQLLYFLDRANEELERASLERRSFIPEMVRSIDEETL